MSNSYVNLLPALFPYVLDCSEAEANKLIRILMRNDKRCRPNKECYGTSFAYTVNFDNQRGGNLWLSRASYERLITYSDVMLAPIIATTMDSSEAFEKE